MIHFVLAVLLGTVLGVQANAQKVYTYVGRISPDSFLLAWGTAEGPGNTIGRNSSSLGKAVVEVNGQEFSSERNWIELKGLAPDTEYPYRVQISGLDVGQGSVRTYPEKAGKLTFFLIGDYGTGKKPQYDIAGVMWREFARRQGTDSPVRFALTAGDNIYPDKVLGLLARNTGANDRDWKQKFFDPYEPLLKQIPFYPTPGNHDRGGRDGDTDEDFLTYLDNFFLPSDTRLPYYKFSYGGLADFFALDTTVLGSNGSLDNSLSSQGVQFRWLQDALTHSQSPWKIAYFHHPPFNAGPGHKASLSLLAHVVKLFQTSGLQVVFSGHEHNFQFTQQNGTTGKTLYVVSGAGGQLRTGTIRSSMSNANIAGTSAQRHFLVVEIEERILKITPLSSEEIVVTDWDGNVISMPLVIHLPSATGRDAPANNFCWNICNPSMSYGLKPIFDVASSTAE